MSNFEQFELSKEQRLYGNIIAGVFTALCGVFLLLCGVGVINAQVSKIWLGSIMAAVGLTLLVTGFIQKNTASIWLSFAFLIPSLIEFLSHSAGVSRERLYPLYIAIPAVSSLVTMLYSKNFKSHINVVLIFGLTALIFSLQSSSLFGWSIVLPILLLFVGALVITYSIRSAKAGEAKKVE